MPAAIPKVPKSTDLVTTADLPSVGLSNGMTSSCVAVGQEAFVEPGRDRVDQLQRAHPDLDRFGSGMPVSKHQTGAASAPANA